jgi:Ser/Thr protein kinase RdoA (MazF antagonist)
MDNILRVTKHQAKSGPALSVILSKDGKPLHVDAEGRAWRSYVFIENASTYDVIETPGQAKAAAKAFGAFQKALADLPGGPLHETIPYFHDTPRRLKAFEEALNLDPQKRAASCDDAISLACSLASYAPVLEDLRLAGALPPRSTHNDTKLNNVMLDDATGEAACVIDLDTVMTGLAPCDFGDMVRSASNAAQEDERDLAKVQFRWSIFEALAKGFLEGAGGFLNKAELENLALAGLIMTYECGLRFLSDHLLGDQYFKVKRENHNLDRARNQFKLALEIEKALPRMRALMRSL